MDILRGSMEQKKALRGRINYIVKIDKSLTVEGASADAKATGDALAKLKRENQEALQEADKKTEQVRTAAGKAQGAANAAQTAADKAQETADTVKETTASHVTDRNNPHGTTAAKLGVVKKKFTAVIGTEWTGERKPYTQSVAVDGILETDDPIAELVGADGVMPDEEEEHAFSLIGSIKTQDGGITLYARKKTEVPISVKMEVNRIPDGAAPAPGGPEAGGSYTLTGEDKEEIAGIVLEMLPAAEEELF